MRSIRKFKSLITSASKIFKPSTLHIAYTSRKNPNSIKGRYLPLHNVLHFTFHRAHYMEMTLDISEKKNRFEGRYINNIESTAIFLPSATFDRKFSLQLAWKPPNWPRFTRFRTQDVYASQLILITILHNGAPRLYFSRTRRPSHISRA